MKLLLLAAFPALALACNYGPPVSEGDCSTYASLTGSFATMTNSAYAAAPGGVEAKVYTYNGPLSLTSYEFRPKGLSTYANVPICPAIHGGGWDAGDATGALVGSNSVAGVAAPVEYVQQFGCVYYAMNYRLAPAIRYPSNLQDVFCWMFEGIASARDGNWNDIHLFGSSAGGHLALMLTLLATTDISQSCPSATSTVYSITRVATMSAVIHLAGVAGSYTAVQSTYQNTCTTNCGSVGLTAVNDVLGGTSNATNAALDVSLQASPLMWMVAGNSRLKIPMWFGGGCIFDQVTGGTGVQGPCATGTVNGDDLIQWNPNQQQALDTMSAIGLHPASWIGPTTDCYFPSVFHSAECKHQADIGKGFGLDVGGGPAQALHAVGTFLFPVAGSGSGGGSGTGDGS